jgi:putative nucleotidyltransferase with HDIG domain
MDFLETLAGQAAIAINNANLYHELQRSIEELRQGYEQTIEGWALTLEMRDDETRGHSQRVTEMTSIIAKKMGIKDDELIHIRRGAILHDIGKMAIPDEILHKPGPLTDSEWDLMKRHPTLAVEWPPREMGWHRVSRRIDRGRNPASWAYFRYCGCLGCTVIRPTLPESLV